jgi:hypothetical protein
MSYNFNAFKYRLTVPASEVGVITGILVLARTEAPNGSSFAVTSDAGTGKRNIHLTSTSYRTLTQRKIIPERYGAAEQT